MGGGERPENAQVETIMKKRLRNSVVKEQAPQVSRCESIIPPLPIIITHNTHISQGEKNKRRSLLGFKFIPALEGARSQRNSGGPTPRQRLTSDKP